MRQTFSDAKVTDFDATNISRKQVMISTIEDGQVRLYSLSYENCNMQMPEPQNYKLEPRFKSRRSNFCLVRLLPYAQKDLLIASDLACNILLFRIDGEADCLARPIHVIFNAHAKLISDIAFMTVPVPQCNDVAPLESTTLDYQHYIASCAYDGYLKIWSV